MNIVAFGSGTNSTAMIIEMYRRGIPIDRILFSDTGGEQPHTYAHLERMQNWLRERGLPEIIILHDTDQNGERLTLEQECLQLPCKSSCFFCPAMKKREIRQNGNCKGLKYFFVLWKRSVVLR